MRAKKAADASQMASLELDRIGDPSATDEERQLRKFMKGPKSSEIFVTTRGLSAKSTPTRRYSSWTPQSGRLYTPHAARR